MDITQAFKQREQAAETAYFHAQDARLLERLRARATLGDIAEALGEKLRVDDPELLGALRDIGITLETGPALLLAPLVRVAWAEGGVKPRERETLLELARTRGVEPGSPACALLEAWLETRPPTQLFELAMNTIRAGLSVLPPEERDDRVRTYINACRDIAMAAGGFPGLFGMGGVISRDEAQLLDALEAELRSKIDE